MVLSLPPDKVTKLKDSLACFKARSRASCRQLQQLVGKLSWASHVVRGGRVYLQRCLDMLRPLKKPHHKVRLTPAFYGDIEWWLQCLDHFNQTRIMRSDGPEINVFTDACNAGAGMVTQNDWAYIDWKLDQPSMTAAHINIKETMAIIHAVKRWAPVWGIITSLFIRITFMPGHTSTKEPARMPS